MSTFNPTKVTMFLAILLLLGSGTAEAGPVAWGICQTACNAAWVACLAGAGITAGVAAPPALLGVAATCSTAQGACMVLCTPFMVAPTP